MYLDGQLAGNRRSWEISPRSILLRRENGQRNIPFIVVASVVGGIIILALAFHIYRRNRRRNQSGQKASQSAKQGPWNRLVGAFRRDGGNYQAAANDDSADGRHAHQLNQTSARRNRDVEQARNPSTRNNPGTRPDRTTSIRSVLTLPAYSHAASHTEQVLGREGDRDGIDVVVDNPTQEDEEELREQEMNALYQLRVARRQHHADREEMRRQRQDASRRQDMSTLSEIRTRSRTTTSSNNAQVEELRRGIDQAKENRQRSVSSVSYADLGVARFDGTRLRANSNDSERIGLLSDAASISLSARTGATSPQPHAESHRRASSVVSIDSDFPSPALGRTRDSMPPTPRTSGAPGRAGSSPELVESDLGVESIPPPEYEDVSLADDNLRRSTTPLVEPPPDYPGPYRSNSQSSRRTQDPNDSGSGEEERGRQRNSRGVGGIPQLPSLRIGRLPEIVIDPSGAHSPTRR